MIMGKERHKYNASKTYVLRVNMHCQCNGCVQKINDAVKEISLSEGVERADLAVEKAEVQVVGTMDPEKLCSLMHELTKKDVKIETQRTVSEGGPAASQHKKNEVGQAHSDPFAPMTPEIPRARRQRDSFSSSPTTPSAPPLPETWRSQALPSERCAYRWSAPSSGTPCTWTASDTTVTLAVYDLSEGLNSTATNFR